MRLIPHAAVCVTAVVASLAPAAIMTTTASASPAKRTAQPGTAAIHITATIPVGTQPSGIAVNPRTNTIYVANRVDGTVSVISGRTNTVVATIPVSPQPNAVAVNPQTNTIYVTGQQNGALSVINGNTNTVAATILGMSLPNGVTVDPLTSTIYVTSAQINAVTVINGSTNAVVASIPVGFLPTGIAANAATDTIYAANEDDSTVSVISGPTNTVTATIPLAPSSGPQGVAVNPRTGAIYVAGLGNSTVSVITGSSVVTTVPLSSQPNFGIAVNPQTNTIYVTQFGGLVSVISGRTNRVVATVPGLNAPAGVAVNPETNTVYITNFGSNTVTVLAPAGTHAKPVITPTQVTFTIPSSPTGVWRLVLTTYPPPTQKLGMTLARSGTLTLPVPQTPTCSFQADVKVQAGGVGDFVMYSSSKAVVPGCGQSGTGQRFTPGYWKNHKPAATALLPQTLGGYTVSTIAQATAIFDAMKCSDAINCLAGHLLATQLDVANGSSICITGVIFQANQLLTNVGYTGPASYTISATRGGQPRSLEQELDNYTNDSTSTSC